MQTPPDRDTKPLPPWAQRLFGRLAEFPPPEWRRPLLVVATALFLGGAVYSALRIDTDWSSLRWHWLLVASVVGVPVTVLANALEFKASGHIVGIRVPLSEAIQVAVLAVAANLLPIPGGALVRVQALRQAGKRYRTATLATLLIAGVWIGVATLLTGLLLLAFGVRIGGLVWTAGGAAALAVAVTLAAVRLPRGSRMPFIGAILAIEVLSVVTAGFRIYLAMLALGVEATFAASALLTFAGVVASVVGIFPGGLGLRELLGASLIPLVGLSASVGFMATAIDRILGLAVHAPLAAYYTSRRNET